MTSSNIVSKQIGPFNMFLDLSSQGISQPLYRDGVREKCFMSILVNEINEGNVCIDLGSNIGYTTLYMCYKAGKTGKVYAIEPDPWNVNMLRRNISENHFDDVCEITECAISDKTEKIQFWQSDKSNLSSVTKTSHSTNSIDVNAYSISDFLQNRQYPNFIKMDIEGHEVKVFEGGLDYFSKNSGPTKILLEVHPQFYNPDNDFAKILKEYFKLGFTNKYVVSTPIPVPRRFKEAGYNPIAQVHTDGFHRGIYGHISDDDLVEFSCYENFEGNSKKIVRSFMIERP
jgi:FkbM family methyltransferase